MMEDVKFAYDSLPEEDGFEPAVPPREAGGKKAGLDGAVPRLYLHRSKRRHLLRNINLGPWLNASRRGLRADHLRSGRGSRNHIGRYRARFRHPRGTGTVAPDRETARLRHPP